MKHEQNQLRTLSSKQYYFKRKRDALQEGGSILSALQLHHLLQVSLVASYLSSIGNTKKLVLYLMRCSTNQSQLPTEQREVQN